MTTADAAAIRALIEPDRVHRDIYIDPAVFELELERIFGRAWIWVAHESQVKNPGDYVTSTIGRQPVVVSRHTDGKVHVLYNRCGHRGAKVVGDREGTVKFFQCCYHGWTYRTEDAMAEFNRPLEDPLVEKLLATAILKINQDVATEEQAKMAIGALLRLLR